jgi:hypothetical protein
MRCRIMRVGIGGAVFGALASLSACATVDLLPLSSHEAVFDETRQGKTGWAQYKELECFRGTGVRDALAAAKVGLGEAGFALVDYNVSAARVVGEHGMTLHDWNVIAGIYVRKAECGAEVLVIVEGSKDVGFSGDVTGGAWTGQILRGMRRQLAPTPMGAPPAVSQPSM